MLAECRDYRASLVSANLLGRHQEMSAQLEQLPLTQDSGISTIPLMRLPGPLTCRPEHFSTRFILPLFTSGIHMFLRESNHRVDSFQ